MITSNVYNPNKIISLLSKLLFILWSSQMKLLSSSATRNGIHRSLGIIMMQCVSSPSYHVVVNHDRVDRIIPQCRLCISSIGILFLHISTLFALRAFLPWLGRLKTLENYMVHVFVEVAFLCHTFFMMMVSFCVKQLQMSPRNSRIFLIPSKLLVVKLLITKN